jgi:uncharacterized protein (DUF362 family)
MPKSKVALVQASPESVLGDIERVYELGGARQALDPKATTILKDNISWHLPLPSSNTTPWGLEGTILSLRKMGYEDLVVVENKTVVTQAEKGDKLCRFRPVIEKYGLPLKFNFKDKDMKWQLYKPKARMLVLDKIFPDGIFIPDFFHGKNIVHLPTVKTHSYTTTTGAMKNAFGGLLSVNRHYTHTHIHETLVDLLAIQKEIHAGVFAMMDGTTSGSGPGPRTMVPIDTNCYLASDDQVAIDAVAAKLMGFDPMSIRYIRVGHEQGLGKGDPREIEIVGDTELADQSWGYKAGVNLATGVGRLLWHSPLRVFQRLFFHTPLVLVFIWGSETYHDKVWWPLKGRKIYRNWLQNSPWGRLFNTYDDSGETC